MEENLVSIIVPVYKVENYINKCIESLISQTYKNLEIILVDDGSPDESGRICDEWTKKDCRIRVVHTENRGAGAARNTALAYANGEYIAFVDSDDYLSLEMYEYMIKLFELDDCIDIVECDYISVEDNYAQFDNNSMIADETVFSTEDAMSENIDDHYFRQLIWNKLYKKNVVEGIWFPEGKKIDDEFWTYQVLGRARKLIHSNKKLYAYRQQEESVMHNLTPDKRLQAIEAKAERYKYICRYFGGLKSKSICDLWFGSIYQIQLIKRSQKLYEYNDVVNKIKEILKEYPIYMKQLSDISLKQKMWIGMASISIELTCWLRNVLRIGL